MGSFIFGAVIFAVLMLWALVRIMRSISINKERRAHHDRCEFCRTRLRKTADKMQYMSVCPKCGRDQPWAKAA